ncbi:MAG: reductive dehalogenase [Candidatus Thorarchaeota archaeon]|nr:MAG: reductive dehalogenase [Candidatus Thorarchaeota archaeon]
MQLLEDLCKPDQCDRECVEACIQLHGHDALLTFTDGDGFPTIENGCTLCLACVRACPYGALTSSFSDEPPKQKKDRVRKQGGLQVRERPYVVSDSYEQFSEKDMIFARVYNDPAFEHYNKDEFYGSPRMISKGLPGYSGVERDMAAAGWILYDSRKSVTGPLLDDAQEEDKATEQSRAKTRAMTRAVKNAARMYGAALAGIAEIDRRWLYTGDRSGELYDIPETIDRAIVMAIEMDYEGISTSPAFPSALSTAVGYSKMAFVEIELSAFIRRLGYRAIPCGNDIALSVPLAIDAGLGQYGRHGLLITKEYGPRVRIAKVLTDMPLLPDRPDTGFCDAVIRFCETCEKCADHCPSKSIPNGVTQTWDGDTRSNNPGVKKWYVNPETCYGFWMENGSDCSNCIRSCPYNKRNGLLHRSVLWVVRHLPWMNRLVLVFDDVMGYGNQKAPGTLWRKFS